MTVAHWEAQLKKLIERHVAETNSVKGREILDNWDVEKGNFLLLGPYKDIAHAGLIIAQARSREALDAILREDVYYPNKASYEIHEFTANKIHPQIGEFIGQ